MKPFRLKTLGLMLGLALHASAGMAANADDLAEIPFEQLVQREVIPASKLAQQISDSPSAVAIVTAADIRAFGYRTLADVINSMRGLYTTYDRRYQYLGGRGFGAPGDYAGRIMLLIDGYATQDSVYNQAYIDESGFLDLELVDRVEYVPGTGSATYGSNALLGIINVITKKGADFGTTQLSTEFASGEGQKQRVTHGQRFANGADLLLSASTLSVAGENLYFPAYDTPATNNGVAEHLDGLRNKRFFGKLSYEGLTIESAYVDQKKVVPTNPTLLTAFNRPFMSEDQNAFFSVAYDRDLSLTLRSASRFYYGEYDFNGFREYADWSDGEKYSRRKSGGKWWGVDQKFVGNWFSDHTLVFGFEYRNDYRQFFHNRYLSPAEEIVRDRSSTYSRHTASAYLIDEVRLDERWSLNVGARYDEANDVAGNLSPRLALIYRPDFKTTWKASYSEAFRMPNALDKSNFGAAAAPEYVAASELVLQHQFAQGLRFTGSLYHYRRSQQMVYSAAVDDYVAAGSSRTHGVEAELERNWLGGTRLRGSLAWQHANDVDGRDLVNSPHLLGKFNLSFPVLGDRLRTGIESQYTGARQTLEQRRLGGFMLTHLTFSSEQKWHGLSASFSIRNLFDRSHEVVSPFDWRPDSGLPQDSLRLDGRTYWFQLNYDL